MGTAVKMSSKYEEMLEIKKTLNNQIDKIREDCYGSQDYKYVFNAMANNNDYIHRLIGSVIYINICYALKRRKEHGLKSNYLVASTTLIDPLCYYLTGKCPGFETPDYLYDINVEGIKLKVIQDSVGRGHTYQFEVL